MKHCLLSGVWPSVLAWADPVLPPTVTSFSSALSPSHPAPGPTCPTCSTGGRWVCMCTVLWGGQAPVTVVTSPPWKDRTDSHWKRPGGSCPHPGFRLSARPSSFRDIHGGRTMKFTNFPPCTYTVASSRTSLSDLSYVHVSFMRL